MISVVRRMGGTIRVLRRARGYAPAPVALPAGFAAAPCVLAMGGELKGSFCLLRDGHAILSHHIGDLENSRTLVDYTRAIEQYLRLFGHEAQTIAIDAHPEYLSSKLGIERAERDGGTLVQVRHHHAHVASCMAENGVPLGAPVLGIALDGLGFGDDATLWGGEFLLADYRRYRRLVCFKPVAMPGGTRAIREPWRNAYAHIVAAMGWERFASRYRQTPLFRFLSGKPIAVLDGMIARGVNAPLASSCGRLFDAVAAAAGVCRECVQYEGQAAAEFEALAASGTDDAYRFALVAEAGVLVVEPRPMWLALLDDIAAETPVPVLSARFHAGLAIAIDATVAALRRADPEAAAIDRIALTGGVFQNRLLLEQ
jgi:hydrogenase maturation protein HypF